MYEIKVLPLNYSNLYFIHYKIIKGQYPDLNREPIVPQTIALPIELYYPLFYYLGVIRTPIVRYQKSMSYPLLYEIFITNKLSTIYIYIIYIN